MKINLGSCIKLKVLFLALSILTFAGVVYASENQVWIEADGEASMGEIETQKEVKERAKIDAQNKVVEQAVGVFIKSHTLVSNNQIAEDLIYA
ncbi:MAG TPA: hypothetical protein DD641_07050, partial [Deltaproteobacteria bacterium]|nr:hypothetical protein [Deltaproteobacteria bacterium]